MSEAKAKYLAAKAAFEETFEKHLQNGVEFISDQVFIDPEVEIAQIGRASCRERV